MAFEDLREKSDQWDLADTKEIPVKMVRTENVDLKVTKETRAIREYLDLKVSEANRVKKVIPELPDLKETRESLENADLEDLRETEASRVYAV